MIYGARLMQACMWLSRKIKCNSIAVNYRPYSSELVQLKLNSGIPVGESTPTEVE